MLLRNFLPLFAPMMACAVLAGCRSSGQPNNPAHALESVLATDRAFARLAAERGCQEAFFTYAASNATMLPQGAQPVHGRESIRAAMSDEPGTDLRWTPVAGEVSASGDLAYTWGTYEYHAPDAAGKVIVRHGKYATIWRRQPDGAWKFVLDLGNPNPPPP